MDIILEQEYVQQIEKESAWALGLTTLVGTLYLVDGGLIFSTREKLLYGLNNNRKKHGIPLPNDLKDALLTNGPLKDCLVIPLDEIARPETGSFKQIGLKLTYTLRLQMKDGRKYIFVVFHKEVADKFVSEITRLIKQT